MRAIRIDAGRPYEALIGEGCMKEAGEIIAARLPARKAALVMDDRVESLYGEAVAGSLARAGFSVSRFVFKAGEASKTLSTLTRLYAFLAREQVSRGDMIVALGGGVTGDLAGFAAASYLRGIPFVQMPTTTLAAVDASVGGKTGVNLPEGKNLVGAFWQPSLVLCDCAAFDTLPEDTFADGVAESLKHGLICDAALFESVAAGAMRTAPAQTVAQNIEIKARMVAHDERDTGARQLLNLGHTVGHAIERLSGFSVAHGHAVAMGIAAMARASEALSLLAPGQAVRIESALAHCRLPTHLPYPPEALAEAARIDKKRSGETITLVLIKAVGECVLYPIPVDQLRDVFELGKGAQR